LHHSDEPVSYWYWGYDVALMGSTAFIGHPYDTTNSLLNAGSVEVLEYSHNEWQLKKDPIVAEEPTSPANFGWALSTSGNTLAIGAPIDDTQEAHNTGAVHVYYFEPAARNEPPLPIPVELVPQLAESVDR
jgi:hypothetical protein